MMQRSAATLVRRALRPRAGATAINRCVGAAIGTQSPVCASSSRAISLGVSKASGSQLSKILAKEIADEAHNEDEEAEREVAEMVQKMEDQGFVIKDVPGHSRVVITCDGKGEEKITITFDVQREVDEEDEEEYDDDEMEESYEGGEAAEAGSTKASRTSGAQGEHDDDDEEGGSEEDEQEEQTGFEFEVEVDKRGDKLQFSCHAMDEVYVRSVEFLPAAAAKLSEEERVAVYHGPVYDELAPELQTAFETYLSDRGIGKDMATFICMYADDKEQKEFVRWMQNIRKFDSK